MNHLKNFFCLVLFLLASWWPARATGQAISALPNTNFVKGADLLYLVTTNTGNATNYSRNIRFDQFIANLQTNGVSTNAVRTNTFNIAQFTLLNGTNVNFRVAPMVTNPFVNLSLLSWITFTNGAAVANERAWGILSTGGTDFTLKGLDDTGTPGTGGLIMNRTDEHVINMSLTAANDITVTAPGINLTGDVNLTGSLGVSGSITNASLSNRLVWADSLGVLRPVTNISGGSFTNGTLTVTGGSSSWPPTNANVLVQNVFYPYTNKFSGTSVIPADNSIPQSSEGASVVTNSFTPLTTNSIIQVQFLAHVNGAAALTISGALFLDSETNTFGASSTRTTIQDEFQPLITIGTFTNTTGSAFNINYRVGPNGANTIYINRGNAASLTNYFLNTLISGMTITETTR